MHARTLVFSALLASLAVPQLVANEALRWRVHAGASWISGLEIGCAVPAAPDPATAPRTDRDYDDGFSRVDATNNLGDGPGGVLPSRTGYFAFERDDQVSLAAGTLTLSSLSAPTEGWDTGREAGGAAGFNLGIRCDLRPGPARWHFGFSADLDWHGRETTTLSYEENVHARRLSDSYQLGGVVPQRAPYTGHYTPQPGDQRIGDIPSRTITSVDATLTGTQSMTHKARFARLGLWCDRRIGERVALSFEGGLALGRIEAEAALADTLAVNDSLSTTRAAEASGSATLMGWFAGLRVHVALSPRWGLAGAYSLLDLSDESDGGVTFDASALRLANVQVSWRF